MPSLQAFLAHKPLAYKDIAYDVIAQAYDVIAQTIRLGKVVHIVGTNGKGSTGRYMAHYLHQKGFKVGHYSSPHVFSFNERLWLDGESIEDTKLDQAHHVLQQRLAPQLLEDLSYFEYTTLLAFVAYSIHGCDYVILEAGLGGELDATNVYRGDKLTLVTTIGLDHVEILGDSVECIARTKMLAVRNKGIIGQQQQAHHHAIWQQAHHITQSMANTCFIDYNDHIDHALMQDIEAFVVQQQWPCYQKDNLALAIAALVEMGFERPWSWSDFDVQMPYRLKALGDHLWADVGHNPLAAQSIVAHFQAKGITQIRLIYNSFSNKDCYKILSLLKPILQEVFYLDVGDERLLDFENLQAICHRLDLPCRTFKGALQGDHLVFGSFLTVEAFMRLHQKDNCLA